MVWFKRPNGFHMVSSEQHSVGGIILCALRDSLEQFRMNTQPCDWQLPRLKLSMSVGHSSSQSGSKTSRSLISKLKLNAVGALPCYHAAITLNVEIWTKLWRWLEAFHVILDINVNVCINVNAIRHVWLRPNAVLRPSHKWLEIHIVRITNVYDFKSVVRRPSKRACEDYMAECSENIHQHCIVFSINILSCIYF